MKKILILHNQISPYRIPLFVGLSHKFKLRVLYCEGLSEKRSWNIDHDINSYNGVILKNKFLGPFYFNYNLAAIFISSRPDIIITVDTSEAALTSFSLIILSKIFNKKIFVWSGKISDEINFFPELKDSTKALKKYVYKILILFTKLYHHFIYSQADRFIAYSNKTAEFLQDYGVDKSKIYIGTQVYPQQLLPPPTKNNYQEELVFLYIGYLEKRKNVELLINAFNKANVPNSTLRIVGDGPEKNKLIEKSKGNNRIEFIDNVDVNERANLYASAAVTILPTRFDVWGFVINESLYYGTPVIVSTAAVASELISEGINGFIFKTDDLDELTGIIQKIGSNKELLKQLRINIKNFPKEKIVNIDYAVNTFQSAIESL